MEFLKGICPHCEGELQIPQGLEKVTCMYCGKELLTADALERRQQLERPEPVSEDEASRALHGLLYGIENPMQYFKKTAYMDFFKKYLYENAKNLAILEQMYLASETQEEQMTRVAESLVERVEQDLAGKKSRKRDELQMDYNLSMVVYLFPALLENNEKSSQAWIDTLVAVWKKHFPRTELKAATSKEINAGFRYRFCYITTAVCESRHKSDDCYELSLLRTFRDDYLLRSDEGEALVQEYYDVAPTIVKHIGRQQDAASIYENIWQQYLSPCIRLIESDENEKCVELYKQMVYNLKEMYFNQ